MLNLPEGIEAHAVADSDASELIRFIGACFAEYEGVIIEPDGVDSDLNAYASSLKEIDGEGIVLKHAHEIVAVLSLAPDSEKLFQLKRIYLSSHLRGSGLGPQLLAYAEERMRARGAEHVFLWSDTRFERAHRFYEREGYDKTGETRELGDITNTTEYRFEKTLTA